MPRQKKSLSDIQSKVLKWVSNGCPDGVFDGYAHRISSRSLADNGYIAITGKGPNWSAKVTKAGRELLEGVVVSGEKDAAIQSEVDRFIERLDAAGGVLEVEGGYSHIDENENLMRGVMKSSLRPKGYKLEIASVGTWQHPRYEASWTRHFLDDVDERPVPVPSAVSKYHPIAKELRDRKWGVSKDHLARAAKLLHALAVESEARGFAVSSPSSHKTSTSRGTTTLDGDIAITIGTTTVALELRELPPNGGAARPYTFTYNHWEGSNKLGVNAEFVSTGRLQLEFTRGYSNGRQQRFRDGQRRSLDDALPAILREIEIEHLEAEWKEEQARLKAEETKRRWEAAMERARTRIQEHNKAEQLQAQAHAWAEVGVLHDYVQALERIIASYEDDESRSQANSWLTWARDYINGKDPLMKPIEIPVLVDYPDDDLVPFLDGWSPHGPHGIR